MKYLFFAVLFTALLSCNSNKELMILNSPSGNLEVVVTSERNNVFYKIISKSGSPEDLVIPPSPLGLVRNDASFAGNLTFESKSMVMEISDSYTMVSGKQKNLSYRANEATLAFKNDKDQKLLIVFRAFDEGVAFRYVFPEKSGLEVTVESEATGFSIPEGTEAWMSPYESPRQNGQPAYEMDFLTVKAGTPSPEKYGWAFPLLFNSNKQWIFISESGLDSSYCGTHLNQDCSKGVYSIAFPDKDERRGDGSPFPSSKLPWTMPWRYIVIGKTINNIVESSMVYHLAEPCKIKELSWIKPGRASWEWWSSTRGRTVKALKAFVDLSAVMKWEYSLIDAGWGNMPDGKIEEVISYAKNKNVDLLFWYNSGGRRDTSARNEDFVMFNDDSRENELARIAALGIKGIKVDFFSTDKQFAIILYQKILADAAKHHLLVNFHGCTLPRGWTRTYPNLLSMEAVRGEECYRYSKTYPDIASSFNTLAAILRATMGPTDYTPAAFSNQKFPHKTTYSHELALTLVYENGIVHMADTPDSYLSLPGEAIEFLKKVPVAWDESRLIAAVPGELFVIARVKDGKWYIAGINGKNVTQEIKIKLPATLNKPTLLSDGASISDIAITTIDADINSLSVKMTANGGFVLY